MTRSVSGWGTGKMAAKLEKKLCINDPRFTYTGKESSPRGLGYCADSEEIGTRREGRDKTLWMVIMKNGVPVWTRVPTELLEETPPSPAATKKATAAAKKAAAAAATAAASGTAFDPSAPSTSKAAEEAVYATPAPAPKKRAPAKKATAAAPAAPAELAVEAEAEEAEKPSAPAPKPKKAAAPKAAAAATAATAAKKPPTDFNVYMKYRMDQLVTEEPDLTNKERFSRAAKDWAALSPEEKKEQAVAAHAYAEQRAAAA